MAFRAKFTFFFKASDGGFTETMYSNDATYQTAQNSARQYAADRVNSLGCGVSLVAARISDDTVFRDSLLMTFHNKDSINVSCPVVGPPPLQLLAGPIFDGLLMRFESGPLKRRSLIMCGFPALVFGRQFEQGFDPGHPTVINATGAWFATLQRRGFGIRVKTGLPKPNDFTVVPFTALIVEEPRSRRHGRPFGQFPGKRLPA